MVGVAAAACSGVFGFVYVAYRFGDRVRRLFRVMDHLHDAFGKDPIKTLQSITDNLQSTTSEIELRQRLAESHLSLKIFVTDATGRCTWANDPFCSSLGMDSRKVRGFGWVAAVAPDDQRRVHDKWTVAVEEGLPYEDQYVVHPQNGNKPWTAKARALPIGNGDQVMAYVGQVEEVKGKGKL